MIWFYSGTNGSGKSLHVAKEIYDRTRRKRKNKVIATFDVATEHIKGFQGRFDMKPIYDITPEWLTEYAFTHNDLNGTPDQVEGQTLVVIDEAQRIFNPRDFNAKDRRAWLDWFPEHRKYGFDFIIISPFDKMIDKQIRALFEYEVKHRKANNFGFIGDLLTVFRVKLFFCITYWYGAKEKCSVERITTKKKYTAIYNTLQRFGRDADCGAGTDEGAESPVGGPVAGTGPTVVACRTSAEVEDAELFEKIKEVLFMNVSAIFARLTCRHLYKDAGADKGVTGEIFGHSYECIKCGSVLYVPLVSDECAASTDSDIEDINESKQTIIPSL